MERNSYMDNKFNANEFKEAAKDTLGIIDKIAEYFPSLKARKVFFEEIENNSNLPFNEKMAYLYNFKKIQQQIKNTASTFNLTDLILKESGKTLEEEIPKLDEDWFCYFDDVAKNFSNSDMQIIWAKILASECSKHGSVSKKVIGILQTIDKKEAETFSFLYSHSFLFKLDDNDYDYEFIYPRLIGSDNAELRNIFENTPVDDISLMNLESLGLIKYDLLSGFAFTESDINATYFDSNLYLKCRNMQSIPYGNISFTFAGSQLVQILHKSIENEKNQDYLDFIINYWEKSCEVTLSNN